jgi:hypothetical protein
MLAIYCRHRIWMFLDLYVIYWRAKTRFLVMSCITQYGGRGATIRGHFAQEWRASKSIEPSTTSQCPSRVGLSTWKKCIFDSAMRAYAHVGRTSYKTRCKVLGGHPIDPVHDQELIINSARRTFDCPFPLFWSWYFGNIRTKPLGRKSCRGIKQQDSISRKQ